MIIKTLDSHGINTTIIGTIKDKDGNVKDVFTKEYKQPSENKIALQTHYSDGIPKDHNVIPFRSLMRPWIKTMFLICICSGGTQTIYYYQSSLASWSYGNFSGDGWDLNYGLNYDEGIRIGSGTWSNGPNSYLYSNVYSLSSSEMVGYTSTNTAVSSTANGYEFKYDRMFVNRYGTSKTVNDVGIVARIDSDFILMARDRVDYYNNPISFVMADGEAINVEYTFTVEDGTGFTKNWLHVMRSVINMGNSETGLKSTTYDISPVTRSLNPLYGNRYLARAGAGLDQTGIILGTGSSALTCDSYVLDSPISHGTSNGQLEYGSANYNNYAVDGSTGYCDLKKNFTNSSGSPITFNELGVVITGDDASYAAGDNHLLIYRALTGAYTLLDTETVEIVVRWSFDF